MTNTYSTTAHISSDPARNTHFRRLWMAPLPPTDAEIRLAELRAKHGNGDGQRQFQAERARQLGRRR